MPTKVVSMSIECENRFHLIFTFLTFKHFLGGGRKAPRLGFAKLCLLLIFVNKSGFYFTTLHQCLLTVCHWNFGRRKGTTFSSKEQERTSNQNLMFYQRPLDWSVKINDSVPNMLQNSLGNIKRKERKSLTVRLSGKSGRGLREKDGTGQWMRFKKPK